MITMEQIRAARAMLGLSQRELAQQAGLSTGTLNNIERGVQTDPKISTLRAIQQALEAEGIEFTRQGTGSYGVQLAARRKTAKTIKLLIIDDSKTDRKLYKAWLTKQADKNYSIIEADNAKAGYDAFLKHKPACILLDFMMYGKDGFQLMVEMKKDHPLIPPIIFMTAMHGDTIRKNALALGVHSFLDKKKLTRERLCDAVSEALA